ncbi:cytochrome P450 CYP749A22-like [Cornus florida]|uniref:cytochrome P450 CYP749A22-like n=1 Tax=Cornus florida TaxID=4283 RepID=UPI0028A0C63B|nr:cytochrome P450 CYP749A22-like [Cornus florida]
MGVLENIAVFLVCSVCIFLLLALIRFLHKVWWTPIRVQYIMRSQGIRGPSYKFLHGNTKEIFNMRRESMSRPLCDLSHNIYPRILPHVQSWVNIYGKNFLNWYGPQAQLVVTEAELVKEILNNREDAYPKIELEGYAKKLLGDGLSSSKGEKWAKLRKLANHVFHAESLKSMIPTMITSSEMMLERWKNYEGKEIEVFEEFRILTSEVISKTAFGSSYLEGKSIFEMLMKLTLIISRNAHKIRFPGISQLLKSRDDIESEKLEQGIRDCITEIIKKRETLKIGEVDSPETDFLGKLLEANHESDKSKWISVEDMVDECKTFYFAGHETTTSLLGWTILLLAVHTDWQEIARKEVLELFGLKTPNTDAFSRLKIMNMIVEESLRLYPPVPAIKRKVEKEVQLGKLVLPPQMELYISPLALHHDPKIWGEDVHLFKPERFAGGVAKATNNTAVAFLPFGFGPRTCVGLNFAIIEAKIALSMILQRYMFTLSPTYVHSPIQLFMVRPQHGVQVIIHAI